MVKIDVTPPLLLLIKRCWQYALYRSWRHARASVRIYQVLAEREPDELRSSILVRLAAHAQRRANMKERHLRKLRNGFLVDQDTPAARVWRWLLVRCGVKWALAWIHRVDHWNLLLSILLVRLTTRILSRVSSCRSEESHPLLK